MMTQVGLYNINP